VKTAVDFLEFTAEDKGGPTRTKSVSVSGPISLLPPVQPVCCTPVPLALLPPVQPVCCTRLSLALLQQGEPVC
jgi:hypothetical protein